MTLAVSFEKSGMSRKRSPSFEPGMLKEQTTSMPMMKSSIGIITFEKRSMPDCTPRAMMKCVSPMNSAPARTGCQGLPTKSLKTTL